MHMANHSVRMDDIAEILADNLGFQEFELSDVIEGNLNYSYRAQIEDKKFFIKVFSNRLKNTKRKYRKLHERYNMEKFVLLTCNQVNFPVPRLVESLDEYRILVEENLEGESLGESLLKGEESSSALYALGLWTGGFHNIFSIETCNTTPYEEFNFLNSQSDSIGMSSNLEKKLLSRLVETSSRIEIEKKVLSRNDCHFDNFMTSRSLLFGIDFEMCSYRPPALDLASLFVSYIDFVAQILLARRSSDILFSSQDYSNLLAGYKEATRDDYGDVFDFYVSIVLVRKYLRTQNERYLDYLTRFDEFLRRKVKGVYS